MGRHKKSETLPNDLSRAIASEKDIAKNLLGDFKTENSRGLSLVRLVSDKDITRESLLTICKALSFLSRINLKRNYTRRRDLLIKWCDENYDKLLPFVQQLEFTFSE